MARVVLYLVFLLVSSVSSGQGVATGEKSQLDESVLAYDQSIGNEKFDSADLDDGIFRTSTFFHKTSGIVAIVDLPVSVFPVDFTNLQPIRAPPILLI